MISSLNKSLNNGAENVKETLNKQIKGIFGTSDEESDSTLVASVLSFSYSDYMRLFLVIGLYSNEEAILLRMADAIQANMCINSANKEYKMANASVYVNIYAEVQVRPTLLAVPLFAETANNPKDEQKWYTIKYNSIKGY